jgi:heme-degrading monooxygenase HmoA
MAVRAASIRGIAMLITVFRSRLKPDLTEEYNAAVARMSELAEAMPGYISHKTFFCSRRRAMHHR